MRRLLGTGRRGLLRALAPLLLALVLSAAASASAQAGTLSGTISAQDRGETPAALAGATVTANDAGSGTPVASATTDPLGGYLLTLPDGDYDVTVSAAGREPLTRRDVAVSGAARFDATLVPTGYGRLHGTVVDSDGDPVADVEVRFWSGSWDLSTVGAADGSFSLAAPQTTSPATLQLSGGPAAESWRLRINSGVTLGAEREIALRVPPMTTLTARVLDDADDSPLEGLITYLPALRATADLGSGLSGTITNDTRVGRTDANGEFSGQVIDHGTLRGFAQQLAVYPEPDRRYYQLSVPPPPVDGPTLATLRLTKYGELTFRLRDADGQPLSAAVWANPSGYSYGADHELRGAVGSTLRLTASPRQPNSPIPDPRPWEFQGDGYVVADAVVEDTLRLPPSASSTVRVVDGDGDPVAGAVVTAPELVLDAGTRTVTGTLRTFGNRATADGDGIVSFDSFAGATTDPAAPGLVVPPRGSGLDRRSYAIDTIGGTTTVVLAEKVVHVDGTFAEADGRAIAGASVTAGDGTSTTTLADGSFAFDVPATTTGLAISLGDVRVQDASVVFEDDVTLALRLPSRVALTVSVTGDGGVALADATVRVPTRTVEDFAIGGGLTAVVTYVPRVAGTDAAGEAVFPLFAGSGGGFGGIRVSGPAGGDYTEQIADLPMVTADTTIAVRLLSPATTPPVLSSQATPVPHLGWWTVNRVTLRVAAVDSDTVVSLTCAVDGVAASFALARTPTSLVGRVAVVGEGRHLVACETADVKGNSAREEWPVDIDRTDPNAPTVAATRPADSDNGWWKDSVTVGVTDNGDPQLADGSAGSGVLPQSVPGPETFTSSGSHTVRATVTDVAGRVSAVGRATVKVDADKPTTTLTCPANVLRPGQVASARWRDADGQSGVAGPATGQIALDTSSAGQRVVYHEAFDRVGHRWLGNCLYTVRYPFDWRGGLVDPPARNGVPAGATAVTLRFSLGGDHGLGVLTAAPSLFVYDCLTYRAIEFGTATISGPLAYDSARGTYSLRWEIADDVPAGRCGELGISLDDGTGQVITFQR